MYQLNKEPCIKVLISNLASQGKTRREVAVALNIPYLKLCRLTYQYDLQFLFKESEWKARSHASKIRAKNRALKKALSNNKLRKRSLGV